MSEKEHICFKCEAVGAELLRDWVKHSRSTPQQIAEIGRVLHPQPTCSKEYKSKGR